jgi:hypothetical protein
MRDLGDGSFFHRKTVTLERETQVMLGQPAVYPQDLVEALRALFGKHAGVAAAFLAQIHIPSSGAPPHAIVGIQADDYETVVRDAGMVAGEVVGADVPVDFVEVSTNDEGLSSYFLQQTQPFYLRGAGRS